MRTETEPSYRNIVLSKITTMDNLQRIIIVYTIVWCSY
jgi:hypothetical protein